MILAACDIDWLCTSILGTGSVYRCRRLIRKLQQSPLGCSGQCTVHIENGHLGAFPIIGQMPKNEKHAHSYFKEGSPSPRSKISLLYAKALFNST